MAIGTLLHGYRIERYIASGGFGNTYLVRHVSLDAVRVMKEFFIRGITGRSTDSLNVSVTLDVNRPLFESQLEKFRGEARRIFGLSHRNVVKVYDLFDENGTAYYVMDYVDGESLQDLVKRRGALPADEIRGYTLQVLDALDAIHSEGIFHLDLKPGNIMIDRQGVLHLIDFGASKQIEADGTAVTTTAAPYTQVTRRRSRLTTTDERLVPRPTCTLWVLPFTICRPAKSRLRWPICLAVVRHLPRFRPRCGSLLLS
ncbi:MAG: serine/threonine protein kinase [Muribaculaceae bacterium]|nr:serine/threonine protein kinase [Muribaculaceae bacterium]